VITPLQFERDRTAERDTARAWAELVCSALAGGLVSQRFGDEAVTRLILDGHYDLAEAVRVAQRARSQVLMCRGFVGRR